LEASGAFFIQSLFSKIVYYQKVVNNKTKISKKFCGKVNKFMSFTSFSFVFVRNTRTSKIGDYLDIIVDLLDRTNTRYDKCSNSVMFWEYLA